MNFVCIHGVKNGVSLGFKIPKSDDLLIMQGILHYFIGTIDYETEEPSAYAVANYKKSLEFLEAFKFNPKATACFIRTSNDIAVVWTEREEPKKAQGFLKDAEKVQKF